MKLENIKFIHLNPVISKIVLAGKGELDYFDYDTNKFIELKNKLDYLNKDSYIINLDDISYFYINSIKELLDLIPNLLDLIKLEFFKLNKNIIYLNDIITLKLDSEIKALNLYNEINTEYQKYKFEKLESLL